MIYQRILQLETKRGISYVDITLGVKDIVNESGIKNGICNIALKSTTAGLLINEKDLLLLKDFEKFFEKLVEENKLYAHPDNAFSHLRAAILRNEITLPVKDGKLILGTWQSILLFEFDVEDRKREVIVTVMGE
jgi:secondary thiamine-phosphate synthase enzyme